MGTIFRVQAVGAVMATTTPPVELDHPTTVPANVDHEDATEEESPEDGGPTPGSVRSDWAITRAGPDVDAGVGRR